MTEPKRTTTQRVQQAAEDVLQLIKQGKRDRAFEKIASFRGDSTVSRYTLIRLLVSIGQQAQNKPTLECALDAFEKLKAKARVPFEPMAYYDIANGYHELFLIAMQHESANIFDCQATIRLALRYGERGAPSGTWALTNLGNLYDEIGRPLEALHCYERALTLDPNFGMALGNKAMTIQRLAPITRYTATHFVQAHQLYQAAIAQATSIADAGLAGTLETFQSADAALCPLLSGNGYADILEQDLCHEPYDDTSLTEFVRFYARFCLAHDLYLNLHLADKSASASIADEIIPPLITRGDEAGSEQDYVNDIMFRLNEIIESYITARLALVQSQYISDDSSTISNQTSLVKLLDYSASNIYVGLLKAAYKEAFSALDKIAILLNHYLALGIPESKCYYGTVWHEHDDTGKPKEPQVIVSKVRDQGARLFGLYLLCDELCGSKYSNIRNALTHRYMRVYKHVAGPRGSYLFEGGWCLAPGPGLRRGR